MRKKWCQWYRGDVEMLMNAVISDARTGSVLHQRRAACECLNTVATKWVHGPSVYRTVLGINAYTD